MSRYIKYMLVLVLGFTVVSAQTDVQQQAPTKLPTMLVLTIDATGSLDRPALADGTTVRELNLGAARNLLRAATDNRENLQVVILRICRSTEMLYYGSVTKLDYDKLGEILNSSLANCDPSDIPGVSTTNGRSTGTDIASAFLATKKLLSSLTDYEVILFTASDGFSQPPECGGEVCNDPAFAALHDLANSLTNVSVSQAIILGVDENVYLDWQIEYVTAFPGIGRAFGVNDSRQGLEMVIAEIEAAKQ